MMPAASQRELVLDAVIDRLEAITVVGGFNTNAGSSVHLNEFPEYGDEQDPATAIGVMVEDDEVTDGDKAKMLIDVPLSIQAYAKVTTAISLRLAYRDAERVLADIKRAFELSDRTMGGLTRWRLKRGTTTTLKRQAGSQFVGVAVQYTAHMHEQWGAP